MFPSSPDEDEEKKNSDNAARLLLQLGFVLPRVVEVVVLGRHGVVVVVDHVIREGAADRFLADGLDVRQGRADARALRREGRSGGTMRVSRAERPGRVDSGRTCRSSSFSRRASAVAWSGATNAPPRPRGRTAGHVSGNATGASGNMVARGRSGRPEKRHAWGVAHGNLDSNERHKCESRETLCRNPQVVVSFRRPSQAPARRRDGVPADARCGRAVPERRRPFRATRVRLVRDAVRPGVRYPRVPARRIETSSEPTSTS